MFAKHPNKLWIGILLLILTLAIGCGGGGSGGGGGNDDPQTDPEPDPQTGSGMPLNIAFAQGDYWEFFWTSDTVTFVQPDTTTGESGYGRYRVTLGAPVVIAGLSAFPLVVTGETMDGTRDMAPRWTHIAIEGDTLWGSEDGVGLQIIYDGSTENWTGGGFFIEFGASETISPSIGQFDGDLNDLSAITVGHETSSGGCETILGHTICSDSATTFREGEYMKEGLGPLGYTLYISYSSSGGGFYTSTQINRAIELIDTNYSAADGSQLNQPPWRELSDMATPRRQHAAAVLDNKIYVMGGIDDTSSNQLSSMEIYNPATDSWSPGPSMPIAQFNHVAEAYNGKIYVIPCCAGRPVLIYDPVTGLWSNGAPIPFDDSSLDGDVWDYSGSFTFNGIAIASPNGALSGDLNIYGYDAPTDQWFVGVSTYTYDQRWFSAGVIGDTLYVAGGYQQYTSPNVYDRARTYNLVDDTWGTSTSDLNVARYDHCSVVYNDKLYVLGGKQTPSGPKLRSMEVYDPQTNTWTELLPMFKPREDFAMVVLGGEIYAIGGNDGGGSIAAMEAYEPQ